jgi:hypothetical protein
MMAVDEHGQIHADDIVSYRTKRQVDSHGKYRQGLERGKGHSFTFTNMDGIKEVICSLDSNYCGYLLFLQCFIDYEGVLINGQKQKVPMRKVDIAKALGLKEQAFGYFFKAMTDNNILLRDGEVFRINKKFHWKGSAKVEHFVKTFTTEVKGLYNIMKPKDLGFIYKLLPYVHLATNLLCENPHEQNVSKIIPLNKAVIAKLTGIDESTVYRKLQKLKLDNMYVFAEVSKGRIDNKYKINPNIFYRQDGKPEKSLIADFVVKGKTELSRL